MPRIYIYTYLSAGVFLFRAHELAILRAPFSQLSEKRTLRDKKKSAGEAFSLSQCRLRLYYKLLFALSIFIQSEHYNSSLYNSPLSQRFSSLLSNEIHSTTIRNNIIVLVDVKSSVYCARRHSSNIVKAFYPKSERNEIPQTPRLVKDIYISAVYKADRDFPRSRCCSNSKNCEPAALSLSLSFSLSSCFNSLVPRGLYLAQLFSPSFANSRSACSALGFTFESSSASAAASIVFGIIERVHSSLSAAELFLRGGRKLL